MLNATSINVQGDNNSFNGIEQILSKDHLQFKLNLKSIELRHYAESCIELPLAYRKAKIKELFQEWDDLLDDYLNATNGSI